MKKIGNVNACGYAILYDVFGHRLGQTLDTPNAVAYAMAINHKVAMSKSYYPMFGLTRRTRNELKDRFKGVMWDMVVLSSYLTWD